MSPKEEYAKAISLFLAELLRTRNIGLHRAADIAQKVLDNINLIDTEEQFLKFTKILVSDFEELHYLKEKISFNSQVLVRKDLERKVREFVIAHILVDSKLASQVLSEAVHEDSTAEKLSEKFPQFKEFIQIHFEPKSRNN